MKGTLEGTLLGGKKEKLVVRVVGGQNLFLKEK